MKLVYCHTEPGNFGDELNVWLWRELLPDGFFDEDAAELFYGIGTILSDAIPKACRKIIFGSGTGYKTPPSLDNTFEIFFVRGPLTARALGIAPIKVITDPAYLILNTNYATQSLAMHNEIAVIPHHLSLALLDWQSVANQAGLSFINPTGPLLEVISRIRQSRLVLTESLHGAILADAFRVPWIPLIFSYRFLEFKWQDWCQSINVEFAPVRLPALFQGKLSRRAQVENFLKNHLAQAGFGPARWHRRPYRQSTPSELAELTNILHQAASNGHPSLSTDKKLRSIRDQLTEQLQQLHTRTNRKFQTVELHNPIQPIGFASGTFKDFRNRNCEAEWI